MTGPVVAGTGAASSDVVAWMDAARAGDREAFGHLWRHYHRTVFKFIRGRVGNPQLAEDLTGNTFVRALARIESFTWQGRDPGAWFITIARNITFDYIKSAECQREALTADYAAAEMGDYLVDRIDPINVVIEHQDNRYLHEAISRLTPDQRDLVLLQHIHELSLTEIESLMGRPVTALKALGFRAKANLRRDRRLRAHCSPTKTTTEELS